MCQIVRLRRDGVLRSTKNFHSWCVAAEATAAVCLEVRQ